MSISSKLTIAMGEIDINYIYDTSHISQLKTIQYTGTTECTHHIQAKIIKRVRSVVILEQY